MTTNPLDPMLALSPPDYSEMSRQIAETIAMVTKPLTDTQRVMIAGAIGVYIEKERAELANYYGHLLRAANARGEWLPIESAPRDGTVVVMGYGEYRERDGFSPAFMRCYPYADGWFVNSMPFYPTHWQPLPAPPGSEVES